MASSLGKEDVFCRIAFEANRHNRLVVLSRGKKANDLKLRGRK